MFMHRGSESGSSETDQNRKSDSDNEKSKEKKERVRPPTKVVIRRLPPTMTKEEFLSLISPVPEHDFFYFVRADKSLGPYAFSRAYINFIKQEDIFTFKEQFDNYTFMDKRGNEYPAVVEFAPFQRIPKKRVVRKKDPKMKTLEQDPSYIAFLESLNIKSEGNAAAQHYPLEYFPPPEKQKVTTTPLLDYLRQKRADKQKMRDDRREERRKKDQERKRLKDPERDRRDPERERRDPERERRDPERDRRDPERDRRDPERDRRDPERDRRDTERDRRRMPNKTDSDSILKVLRNPVHEKEIKEDNGKEKQQQQQQQQPQHHQQHHHQQQQQQQSYSSRRREEDRQRNNREKDVRQETRSHTIVKSYRDDRQKQMELRAQRKMSDEQRKKLNFERSQVHSKTSDNRLSHDSDKSQSFKTSETRRSQEFDKTSGKLSETLRSQEFERSHSSFKPTDSRRGQDYDRRGRETKYYSGDQRKMGNERYKDYDHRKTYRESENRRSNYNKEIEQKKNYSNDQRRFIRNYSETENRRNIEEKKFGEQKVNKELHKEIIKTEKEVFEEPKKWENMGAKPKKPATEDTEVEKVESVEENKDLTVQTSKTSPETETERNSQETGIKELEEPEKNKKAEVKNSSDESHLCRTERSKSEEQSLTEPAKDTEHKHGAVLNMRRGSLDSGDHEAEMQSNRMQRNTTGSDWSMEAKVKRDHSLEMESSRWERRNLKCEKSVGYGIKAEDKDKNGDNGAESEQKRDPRAERRIRNKDRPSIEIYRPGMGKFSMQRKEREKSTGSTTGTTESSMEQESPSSSPSPTPVNMKCNKAYKNAAELRSMTFKRSVSREK